MAAPVRINVWIGRRETGGENVFAAYGPIVWRVLIVLV